MTVQTTMALTVSEDDLKAAILDLAHLYRWRIVHIRPAKTVHGWRTAYEGDSGLPDLIMARNGVVLLCELKSEKGKATPEQLAWLAAAGPNGHLWRPSSWDKIVSVLR